MEQATQRFSTTVEEFARQVQRLRDDSREESSAPRREPRGPLFHGEDPTLAQRAEEALHVRGE